MTCSFHRFAGVSPSSWQTYARLASLAKEKYGLQVAAPSLPERNISQGAARMWQPSYYYSVEAVLTAFQKDPTVKYCLKEIGCLLLRGRTWLSKSQCKGRIRLCSCGSVRQAVRSCVVQVSTCWSSCAASGVLPCPMPSTCLDKSSSSEWALLER